MIKNILLIVLCILVNACADGQKAKIESSKVALTQKKELAHPHTEKVKLKSEEIHKEQLHIKELKDQFANEQSYMEYDQHKPEIQEQRYQPALANSKYEKKTPLKFYSHYKKKKNL